VPNEAKTDVRVYLVVGGKRTFASAADWPGWCRSGKDEQAALAALAAYASRYAAVARLAKAPFIKGEPTFTVVERIKGNGTTDYGAPGVQAKDESKPLNPKQVTRMRDLLEASWDYLDKVVAKAPPSLRKGPRGGGRDRDVMFDHVLGAEVEYAKRIGVRQKQPDGRDKSAVRAFRNAILEGFNNPNREERWPLSYAARRTAWHALDHAWEIEDRSTP
jgi:enoyl-CoA hydratase/carnithine racemase